MSRFLKFLFVITLLGGAGAAIYIGGKKGVSFFYSAKEPKKAEVVKKEGSAKPKTAPKNSSKGPEETRSAGENEYTFFETLNDSSMKKIVGLDSQIRNPAPAPAKLPAGENAPAKKEKQPETAVPQPKEEKNHVPPKPNGGSGRAETVPPPAVPVPKPAESGDGAYSVQVSSFRELARAQSLQSQLQKKGYPAFLLTAGTTGEGGILYRVFLGKYDGLDKAKEAARKAKQEDKLDTVVVQLPE